MRSITKQQITSIEILGKTIKSERNRRGLTQTELGNITGVKQKTISSAENGSSGLKLDTLFRILAGLNMSISLNVHEKEKAKGKW